MFENEFNPLIYEPGLGRCLTPSEWRQTNLGQWPLPMASMPSQDQLPVVDSATAVSVPDVVVAIRSACAAIDEALLERFYADPRELYMLGSRDFEMFVASILDRLGYQVELTKATRDGGYDIFAINNRALKMASVIECKRYAETHPVSVGVVRAIHGVASHLGVHGVIVTTSYFTNESQRYLDAHPWQLEGRDLNGIVEWIAKCRRCL